MRHVSLAVLVLVVFPVEVVGEIELFGPPSNFSSVLEQGCGLVWQLAVEVGKLDLRVSVVGGS